jgi:protein-tyrosine phosphatase
VPVITHPERNPILRGSQQRLQKWIEMGCLLQVAAQSLTDRFGKAPRESAWALPRNSLVHFIASDAHDTEQRPPRLDHAGEILTAEMGAEAASLLLEVNPAAVIRGERAWVQSPASPPKRK